jgi:long-chain acyl-CoA synthetase
MVAIWLLERMAQWKDITAIIWRDTPFIYRDLLEKVALWKRELDAYRICSGQVVSFEGDYSPNACAD